MQEKVCPFCGAVFEYNVVERTKQGSVATAVLTSIECNCGATWAIQRPRAVKANARSD